jgi:radical SAM protein with 4Fe4S-binding SPASM domain
MAETEMIVSLRLWNLNQESRMSGEDKNRTILEAIEKEFALPYKIQEKVVPGRGIKIAQRVYLNQEYQFKWPDLKEKADDGKGFCYGLRNQAAILVDGTVVPCCLDGEGILHLGNIHQTPFSQIIQSKRACDIKDGFSRREAVEELCKKCGYRQRFGKTQG